MQYSRLQVERKTKRNETNKQTNKQRNKQTKKAETNKQAKKESLNWYKSSPQHHIFYRLNQELVKVIMFGKNEKNKIGDKICQFALKNLRKMFHLAKYNFQYRTVNFANKNNNFLHLLNLCFQYFGLEANFHEI